MTFAEKNAWAYAAATLASLGIYLAVILGRARHVPLVEVAYVAPMLWTMGATFLAAFLAAFAIEAAASGDAQRRDERDRKIERRGEYAGRSLVFAGALGGLALALVEADHFWIANALYLALTLSALLSSIIKIAAYRRGVPEW